MAPNCRRKARENCEGDFMGQTSFSLPQKVRILWFGFLCAIISDLLREDSQIDFGIPIVTMVRQKSI